MAKLISVLLPLSLPEAFVYSCDEDLKIKRGDFVLVPLSNKKIIGVVWNSNATSNTPTTKIKNIIEKIDIQPLDKKLCDFVDWVADYTVSQAGNVLKMAISTKEALKPSDLVEYYSIKNKEASKITDIRQKIINYIGSNTLTAKEIKENTGASLAVLKSMREKGFFNIELKPEETIFDKPSIKQTKLSEHQEKSANEIKKYVANQEFKPILLDGVTGSGKTEVYFNAIEEALKIEGSQALIMLPEIALTAQITKRFKEKFGLEATQWHSSLTPKQREKNWRRIKNGSARIIIGARSSLFLPYKNLRLIIIDEEHDTSYKQEDNVIYNARDMAIVRGNIEKFPVVLVSATPSIETMTNAVERKYEHLKLRSRHGKAVLPDVKIIDMRKKKLTANQWLSDNLSSEIEKRIEQNQQSMLFLNRRGYAPLKLCRNCGFRFQCPNCSSWLVEHKKAGVLTCHHCEYNQQTPNFCPECDHEETLVSCGPGVERLAEEVEAKFPNANVVTITGDSITSMSSANDVLSKIENGEADIIIGTQVIAKGHHFPKLTLVGIVDADMGLEGGDLRASERCYQLLNQVSGRAGREEEKGTVIIQSYMPDNAVMNALANYSRDEFIECESKSRERTNMPPYSRLVAIIISGKNEQNTLNYAKSLVNFAPKNDEIRIMGPVAAPMFYLRGNYRFRILLKAQRNINIQKWVKQLLNSMKPHSSINVRVDVDPYSFM